VSYQILTTSEFEKQFNKLDLQLQKRISQKISILQENPFNGKPLGYKFLREQKVLKYRFYYIVYKEFLVVFIIKLSSKKDQQKCIDSIRSLVPYYHQLVQKKINVWVSTQ
jgi:mRNA-degrading endonuclease RelE of RelBE toxin-antitoxin system